jgi:hypothetical protein
VTDANSVGAVHDDGSPDRYAVLLTCGEIDQFGHNEVFAEEIGAALTELGVAARIVDYRRESRRVHDALRDKNCAFLVCFNGFGSELSFANRTPDRLVSAFGYYRKLLFDLMHDCPTHESMAHQMRVLDGTRQLLLTDYGYVQEALELGVPHARFIPSITFPKTLPPALRDGDQRPIPVLLPVKLPPTSEVDARFGAKSTYLRRIFREIYESVTDACVAYLGADPRVETRRACSEASIYFDVHNADHRLLLTAILDRTKFARRRALVQALRGLPVTLITADHDETDLPEGMSTAPARSFRELLALMAEAAIVLCPLPHMTGFHERALGAFTAGAAVIAAPNDVLETQFRHGQDMLTYRSETELAALLPDLLAEPDRLRAIARCGQAVALDRFAPRRLAETILSICRLNRVTPEP